MHLWQGLTKTLRSYVVAVNPISEQSGAEPHVIEYRCKARKHQYHSDESKILWRQKTRQNNWYHKRYKLSTHFSEARPRDTCPDFTI